MSLARAIKEAPQRDAEILEVSRATGRTVDSVRAEVCYRCARSNGDLSVKDSIAEVLRDHGAGSATETSATNGSKEG
jgi:hypothetical protein